MTDPISAYNRLAPKPAANSPSGDAVQRRSQEKPGSSAAHTSAPVRQDEVVLSGLERQAMASETFDSAKVAAIKEALQNGQYPLDSRRIAESFYAMERLIQG